MSVKSRRDFLQLCVSSVPALALAHQTKRSPAQPVYRTPALLERYIDPLPMPGLLKPYSTRGDKTRYRIRILEFRQQLHSQLPPTKLWGFEGQYPGPTIEALRDKPIEVRWENHLPSQHIFAIDPHIHGAMPPAPRSQDGTPSSRLTHSIGKRRPAREVVYARIFGTLLLSE